MRADEKGDLVPVEDLLRAETTQKKRVAGGFRQ
jgi:hypothetical protein